MRIPSQPVRPASTVTPTATNAPEGTTRALQSISERAREIPPLLPDTLPHTPAQARRLGTFAVTLTGTALHPKHWNGDLLVMDALRHPASGGTVLARLSAPGVPAVVMFLNADGDLTDNRGGFIERGRFLILAVVIGSTPERP